MTSMILVFVAIFALSNAAPVEEAATTDLKTLETGIKDFFKLTESEADFVNDIIELKNVLFDAIEEGLKKVESMTDEEKKSLIVNLVKDAKQKLGNFLKHAAEELGTVVASVLDIVGNIVEGFHKGLTEKMNTEKTDSEVHKEIENRIGEFLASGFTTLKEIMGFVDQIGHDVVKGIATVAADVINGIEDALSESDREALEELGNRLVEILENLNSPSSEESASTVVGIDVDSHSGIDELVDILDDGSDASAEIIDFLNNMKNEVHSSEASPEENLVAEFVSEGFNKVQEFVGGVIDFITEVNDIFKEGFKQGVEDAKKE